MTTEEMLVAFRELAEELVKTIENKNHDYAKGADPFKNLRRHGCYGIVVRMDDKISRLDTMTNPAHGNPVMRVKDESFDDTSKDLAAYALLNILLRRDVKAQQVVPSEVSRLHGICRNPLHNPGAELRTVLHFKNEDCQFWIGR